MVLTTAEDKLILHNFIPASERGTIFLLQTHPFSELWRLEGTKVASKQTAQEAAGGCAAITAMSVTVSIQCVKKANDGFFNVCIHVPGVAASKRYAHLGKQAFFHTSDRLRWVEWGGRMTLYQDKTPSLYSTNIIAEWGW